MHSDILALYGRSFRAQLYLNSARGLKPLRLSRSDDSFSWTGIAEDGWLQVGSDGQSPAMDFVFRHSSSDRLYFDITLPGPPRDSSGQSSAKRLGISINGFLGFYWVADVTEPWKIEPLAMDESGLLCHLRDHLGQRVGIRPGNTMRNGQRAQWLNTLEGQVQTFVLRQA